MNYKAAYQQELNFYQQGNKSEAERLFRTVIKKEPSFADAWNALGVLAQESEQFEDSIPLIQKAISLQAKVPDYHTNLALNYFHLQKFEEEERELNIAIQLAPQQLNAQCRLADLYRQRKDYSRALPLYQTCIVSIQDNPLLYANLSICFLETQDFVNAEKAAIDALRLDAENQTALLVMARVLINKGRHADAIRLLEKLAKLNPNFDIRFQLATAHMESGDYATAIPQYRLLTEEYPQSIESIGNLGVCYFKSGQHEHAWNAFTKALSLEENAEFYNMLGMIRQKETKWEEAIGFYQKALSLDPNLDKALANLGNLYTYTKKPALAVDYLTRATVLFPANGEYRMNLAVAYMALDDFDHAIEYMRMSTNMAMITETTHFNLSQALLTTGHFEEGWKEFCYRPSRIKLLGQYPDVPFVYSLPEDVRGKRILLWAEQGIGDELQFMRFVSILKQRGAYCICQATPKIISLIKRLTDIDEVVPRFERPPVDFELLCTDLPMILHCNQIADIPPLLPMQALPKEIESIRQQLKDAGPPPYIGLTWRGGTSLLRQKALLDPKFAHREIDPPIFCEGVRPLAGTFIALQRQPQPGELAEMEKLLGRPLLDFTALNDQLETMLALLNEIDQYIAVPNTNVYFRSSLGKSTQVMLTTPAGYTWLRGQRASFWYPHAVLHRATIENDWNAAFADMRASVLKELNPA